jgi:hypothetical protein
MDTRSAREHTMFAPAQFLRSWREKRPSNKDDLESSVKEEVGRVLHGGGPASDFIFVPLYVIVVGLHFKWRTVYLPLASRPSVWESDPGLH